MLRCISDIERILSRVALGTIRPRDLIQLKLTLDELPKLKNQLQDIESPRIQTLLESIPDKPEFNEFLK